MPNTLMSTPSEIAPDRDILHPDGFESFLATLPQAPSWNLDLRRKAYARFSDLPMPKRTDEAWRFASIHKLGLENYHQTSASPEIDAATLLTLSNHMSRYAGKTVFCDGFQVNHFEVSDELREKGVIWMPIAEALATHSELLQEYFRAENPELGSEKFLALHTAFLRSGTFLYVPDNVEIDAPFLAYHWTDADRSSLFPHTLIVTGRHAKVKMIDFFQARQPDSNHLVVGSASVFAGEGAKVGYKAVQDWNLQTQAYHLNTMNAERDAEATYTVFNTGSAYVRNEQNSRINGPGARVNMYSLGVTTGTQELDQRTLQTHLAGNAVSDLLYKNVLLDDSRTVFSGLIRVAPDAQLTDAYQTNRNLVLSETAEANSLPGLEIEANDVKCSHGATTSRISEEELFYLRARGIPMRTAQAMLVFGFFEEIIDKLETEELAEFVRGLVQKKFHEL